MAEIVYFMVRFFLIGVKVAITKDSKFKYLVKVWNLIDCIKIDLSNFVYNYFIPFLHEWNDTEK